MARFRAMLARNPDLPRVRLDLALAYFQAEDDGNAACHFRLALGAKDLPETVRASALAFLDRIRRRKRWSVTGSVAVVPDTNINARTDAREILLFGQRATLSEDARRTSGVGVTIDMSGGYEGRVSPDLRFRVGGGLQTRTCRESDFNEQIVEPVRRAALPVRQVRPASRRDRAAALARRHRLQLGAGYRAFGRGRHGGWARRSAASGSTTRRAISARATSIPSGSTSPMRWTKRRCCGPTPHGAVRRWTWTPIPGASSSSD